MIDCQYDVKVCFLRKTVGGHSNRRKKNTYELFGILFVKLIGKKFSIN